MAAGPADAFCSAPCGFSCYDRELISAAADNLWSSNVVATASTGASWVDDVDVGISSGGGPHSHHHASSPSQNSQQHNNNPLVHLTHHHHHHHPQHHLQHRPIGSRHPQNNTNTQPPPPPSIHQSSPKDTLEERILELKQQFHRGRILQVKHLPRECTEEELRDVLMKWDVQSVNIQAGSARVNLTSPEVLEDWDRNAVFTIRGQRVTIVPSPTEMLLCVGRLPLSYTEQQFTALVGVYGEIKRGFLMISQITGESKGYGFVEYVTKEAALQAKNALDGRQIMDCTGVCDWLDSSHTTFRSLHSKCLYVDQLPPNYRNMGEFRRIFSTIVNPPYCQIALKNGCPQDWGLVEFLGEDEAEKTQQSLNGYIVHGMQIRVAYYIPGVRAINLYLKLLNDGGNNKGRSALLPDPPAPAVFQQLQSLAKQNPVFAQNLQSIILQQIQDAQKGKSPLGPGNVGDSQGRGQYPKGQSNYTNYSNNGSNSNVLKNAQQTALTLLLATQQIQQQNGDNLNSGELSPSNSSLHNQQQLLSALQAVSKGDSTFLNGIPTLGNNTNPLTSLLGLTSPGLSGSMNSLIDNSSSNSNTNSSSSSSSNSSNSSNSIGLSKSISSSTISHGYFPNPLILPPSNPNNIQFNNIGLQKDEHWTTGFSKQNNRISNSFIPNGFQKNPLLPNPSTSPMLDTPMDTNAPKTPPNDSLQAVWYSLFGHSDTGSCSGTSGHTSPLFMKNSSSVGSPITRSDTSIYGHHHHHHLHYPKSSPPGFSSSTNNGRGHCQSRLPNGDLQDAVNSILTNSNNFTNIFGNTPNISPPPQSSFHSQLQTRSNSFNELSSNNTGMSNAILDLLLHSMKNDQQFQQQQHQPPPPPPPLTDAFGRSQQTSWSSGLSSPPSPIGNNRQFTTGTIQPQRSGSNGSSEMSGSSPRSPTYSPFRHSTSKGLLESGNGDLSPTSTSWTHTTLGSPTHSTFGNNSTTFPNRIWAPSIPSITPTTNGHHPHHHHHHHHSHHHHQLNPMGQKRKVRHDQESMSEGDFLTSSSPSSSSSSLSSSITNTVDHHFSSNLMSSNMTHYADSYFKKKKKT